MKCFVSLFRDYSQEEWSSPELLRGLGSMSDLLPTTTPMCGVDVGLVMQPWSLHLDRRDPHDLLKER